MKNIDIVRAMSIEELARWLVYLEDDCAFCKYAEYQPDEDDIEERVEWLNKEDDDTFITRAVDIYRPVISCRFRELLKDKPCK